ncbi:SMP-30/gluconolactonase/LRE family protein [Pseudoalteromonas ulvae]|uniref:SMP-30/gluconolactonase/LRE family protein n=1 Tax=Pseudoalteromonas ulvae TaxID=107327 RepID=UPI00186B9994|nr:SMP-30/gluconolactonase/LRE family protein [Pseudoalteromonas ulvae]
MRATFLSLLFMASACGTLDAAATDSQDFVMDNIFTQGVEGPVVSKQGQLFAVNFAKEGTIGIVTPSGEASLYVTLPKGSTGNGLQFDANGDLLVADYTGHNVLKVDTQTKEVSVLAHNPNFNQPNDIAVTNGGFIFASDPNWADSSGQLWRVSPDSTSLLLEKNMGTTNGVAVSADQTTLFVNESVQRVVWAYDLDSDYQISNKRQFIRFDDFGLDGMRTDSAGHLYIARYGSGTVVKLSKAGKVLKTYQLKGQHPTNVALNPSEDTLYVTMQKRGSIEVIKL